MGIDDLKENCQVYGTIRRTLNTLAREFQVNTTNIDIGVERAKGRRSNRPVKHHYATVTLLLKPFLYYTRAHKDQTKK